MPRRHTFEPHDWASVARRLDELVSARSGEDAYSEILKLIVARLLLEQGPGDAAAFPRSPEALDAVLARAAWRWDGVLADPRTRLDGAELNAVAAVLDRVTLGPDRVGVDAIFQAIVSRSARGERGQYFTPRDIIRDVVRRVGVRPGERVCDPACGSGGFLLEALRVQRDCDVWAFDHDPRAIAAARVLLTVSGVCPSHIVRADSLSRAGGPEGPFDLILTNPPFAGEVDDAPGYTITAGLGRVERDALFLERCVDLLRPGGRLAILVPDGKVGSTRQEPLRRWLLANVHLTEVIALPRGAFLPYTSQKACVLIGEKRGEGTVAGPIRFQVGLDGPSAVRAVADLASGLILSPERYVADDEPAEHRVTIGDLVDVVTTVRRPTAMPTDRPLLLLDVGHAWEGLILATHAPVPASGVGSPKALVQPGDVVISRLRSYLRQAAYIGDDLYTRAAGGNHVAVSAEFVVLRGRPGGVPAAALLPHLLTEPVQQRLASSEAGGQHPRFRKETLAGIEVPDEILENAAAIAARVARAPGRLREALALLEPDAVVP